MLDHQYKVFILVQLYMLMTFIRTTAATCDEVQQQADVIQDFTQDTCLNLNVSKLEVVKISKNTPSC